MCFKIIVPNAQQKLLNKNLEILRGNLFFLIYLILRKINFSNDSKDESENNEYYKNKFHQLFE